MRCIFLSRREGAKHNKKVVLDLLRQHEETKDEEEANEAADCNFFPHLLFIFGSRIIIEIFSV